MTKFKVGDKVKIIANTAGHMFDIGEIVYIQQVFDNNYRAGRKRYSTKLLDWWYVGKEDIAPIYFSAKVV